MGFLESIGFGGVKAVVETAGTAIGSVMDRAGFTKKLSEAERIDKYVQAFGISENSTDSARQMFVAEMKTQKQPWVIRLLNGLVRPFGGLGALGTEFYALWGANISTWFGIEFIPITINTEQHLFLGSIAAFYFGSRLSEVVKGVSTKR